MSGAARGAANTRDTRWVRKPSVRAELAAGWLCCAWLDPVWWLRLWTSEWRCHSQPSKQHNQHKGNLNFSASTPVQGLQEPPQTFANLSVSDLVYYNSASININSIPVVPPPYLWQSISLQYNTQTKQVTKKLFWNKNWQWEHVHPLLVWGAVLFSLLWILFSDGALFWSPV